MISNFTIIFPLEFQEFQEFQSIVENRFRKFQFLVKLVCKGDLHGKNQVSTARSQK